MIQFLNIGTLFIFSDFTLGYTKDEWPLPILMGNHKDFDTKWYYDVGAKITMAMISNSIAPHIGKMLEPFIQKILRYLLDRCCKKHLRKKTNIEEELGIVKEEETPGDAKSNAPQEEGEDTQKEGGGDT
mmetsp:Transcript_38811/g.58992  ORF Transcript_38811/g.58992 Transcript_38811/m.58992 type:complete len:129 (+) Transcript_38811:1043-1429(+)